MSSRSISRKRNSPVEEAARVFEKFHGQEATSLERVRVKLSGPLVRIGEVPELHYLSDKEGELAHYYHKVERPGTMYADPSGEVFIILGGSTRVSGRWLEENPASVLSQGNIRRALLAWRKVRREKRKTIADPRSYVLAAAWDIQRARLKKYGHR